MRPISTLAILCVLAAGPGLQAQQPHFGFGLNLSFPTGEFRSFDYPTAHGKVNEGFDLGLGGQFTISFPLQQSVAFRMNFNGQSTSGTQSETGHGRLNIQHNIFSVGGEMQFFLNGSAFRHRGTYFFFGPSADFERWDYTHDDYSNYYNDTYDRKSRMGATFGIGNSFGNGPGRFTLEMAFHKTLSGNSTSNGDPASADFVKLGFGWVW